MRSSKQLYDFVAKKFFKRSINYINKAKPICENILKEPKISDSNSPKILEFKTNLTEFIKKYDECKGYGELRELHSLYFNLTSFYLNLFEESSFEEDTEIIVNILKKYDLKDLENDLNLELLQIAKKVHIKFEDDDSLSFVERLKADPDKESEEILKWYDEFKNLKSCLDIKESFVKLTKIVQDDVVEPPPIYFDQRDRMFSKTIFII